MKTEMMIEEAQRAKTRLSETQEMKEQLEDSKRARHRKFVKSLEKNTVKKLRDLQLENRSPNKKPISPKKKVKLVITIEIGDGNLETIKLYENETPDQVARAFVAKHQFPEHIIEPLRIRIEDSLAQSAAESPKKHKKRRSVTKTPQEEDFRHQKTMQKHKMTKEELDEFTERLSHRQIRLQKEQYSLKAKEKVKADEHTFSPDITRYKGKKERTGSVFDRLYGESKNLAKKKREEVDNAKKQEQERLRMSSNKVYTLSKSATMLKNNEEEAVYDRLNKLAKEKQAELERIAKEKKEEEEKKLKKLTFKPEISRYAKEELTNDDVVWDRVAFNKELTESREQTLKNKYDRNAFKEVSSIFKHDSDSKKFMPARDPKADLFSPQLANRSKNG
eukprot:TRINITY_DN2183_c0_g1_i1.p1 TRINITY_DN2183_c0_g1~~TRINITY_DN2183_c0_g1_i1.p1  ORF type:complete len:391 (-),score=136.75 TRINITY_DN2183_c0_g1_i1:894-2066(-)